MTTIRRGLMGILRRIAAAALPTIYAPYANAPVAGWAGVLRCPLGPVAFVSASDGSLSYRW